MDTTITNQFTSAPPTQSEFEEILGMKPSLPKPAVSINTDITSLAHPKGLTLHEKQGFVKEQEAARRLHQEPILNPTHVLPKAPPPVKDLTISLMENNLKQISINGPNVSSIPQQTWSLPPSVAPTPALVAPVNAAPMSAWSNQSWRPVAPTAWQNSSSQFTGFPAPQFQLSTNKVPMNSMVNQPTFQNSMMNGMKPAQPTKQLSNTEINDFLS